MVINNYEFSSFLAAERRKICSPRREPWVTRQSTHKPRSGDTIDTATMMFRPSRASLFLSSLIPWLAPWAIDLSRLRGWSTVVPDQTNYTVREIPKNVGRILRSAST